MTRLLFGFLLIAVLGFVPFVPAVGLDDHDHAQGQVDHEPHDDHDAQEEKEGHDHHEDEGLRLDEDVRARMGIAVEQAGPRTIRRAVPLIGRITFDQNRTADVRARFEGLVRSVHADLGARVTKGQRLAVVEANESLRAFTVTAPINGVVLSRNTNVGDVSGSDPLFRIVDLSQVWAKFHIFPRDAGAIAAGQTVRIHTLEGATGAEATITMLFPTADALSQTLIAIVPLGNADGRWKPGMVIEGDVVVERREVGLAVKRTAIQKMEGQGDVIFIEHDGAFEPRPIKTGLTGSEWVEVTEGVEPGAAYAAKGSFVLKSDLLKSTAAHSH